MVLVLAACSGGDGSSGPSSPAAPAAVASVSLSQSAAQLESGESLQVTATAKSAKGDVLSGRATTWSTANGAVATVSSAGLVSAVAPGNTTVTATVEGQTAVLAIAVVPAAVASVTVALSPATLEVGQLATATATARDARNSIIAGRTVSWTSSNAGIASVATTGVVTPLAPGSTTLSATVDGRSGTAPLTVVLAAVASVTITFPAAVVNAGLGATPSVVLRDARNAVLTSRTLSWATSDAAIATVNVFGNVTTVAPGPVTITVTAEGKSASAVLMVWSSAAVFTIKDSIVVLQYPQIWDVHPRFDPVNFPNPRVQPGPYNLTRMLPDLAAFVDATQYDFVALYSLDSVPGWINSGGSYGTGAQNIGISNGSIARTPPAGWPRLRSVPHMNSIEYIDLAPSAVRHQLSSLVLFHEIGHHWGVYSPVNAAIGPREWNPSLHPLAWLAGVGGHWAFNWSTSACPCPVGILTSGASDVKFNAFDLYAMGLMGYQEVKQQSYTVYELNANQFPDPAKPHSVNVDTLINAIARAGAFYFTGNGHRIPDTDASVQSLNVLPVLVAGRDQTPSAALVSRLLQVVRDVPVDWPTATWGRSQMTAFVRRR